MKELVIVFTKSKKILPVGSWAIRLWTNKPYSHVARSLTLYGDVQMYYQASGSKVNYEVKEVFDQHHEIVKEYKIMLPEDIYKQVGKACVSEAGKPYGTLQNLGIALVDIVRLFGIKLKNPWKKGLNCSELLYRNVFKVLHPELDYNPDTIKPHNIEEILDKYYKK